MSLGSHAALSIGYDWRIVAASLLVACLSAYTALDLTGPAAEAKSSHQRLAWTFAGTGALAIGVWSMHFIGMQAFRIGIPLHYNPWLVAASFIVAFAGAMVSLWWLVRGALGRGALIASAILLGLCLAGMHYTGMAALELPAAIDYNPIWVAVSVIIAIVTSYAAFVLAGVFGARHDLRAFVPKAATSALMGLAIVSVHYTGMAAATFSPLDGLARAGFKAGVAQGTLAALVTGATLVVLALFLLSSFLNERNRERRSEEARFRLLASSSPNLICTLGMDGCIEYFNPRFESYAGHDAGNWRGLPFDRLIRDEDRDRLRLVLAAPIGREPRTEELMLRAGDGSGRWHVVQFMPLRTETSIAGWLVSATDVQEQKQAHESAAFLEEATRVLNLTLDVYATLDGIANLVCRYAEWCEIQFEDAAGMRQAVACGDLSKVLTGTIWRSDLATDDRVIGRFTLVRGRDRGAMTSAETQMFEHLCSRLAAAVQRSNLYQREHRVARSFQEASLPALLPQVPGMRFDAVYTPSGDDAMVGGDWYDALRLIDGRVVVSIGDVAGSGLDSAVTMGSIRQIIRGIAQVHANPALMLDAADRALRIENDEQFATAFVGVIDPIAKTLTYASAGHPEPILRSPDGTVRLLSGTALPLGLRETTKGTACPTVDLENGSVLVLYTDGLTEAGKDPIKGEQRLAQLVGALDFSTVPKPARWLRHAFLDGKESHDDVALMVVRMVDDGHRVDVQSWDVTVTSGTAAQTVRSSLTANLRAHGVSESEAKKAEIVLGELIGNVVRHAGKTARIMLDWTSSAPVLHVMDDGPGFSHIAMLPKDPYSESGRGLFIVSELTLDFRVNKRPHGGSHARAVLDVGRRELTAPLLAPLSDRMAIL